jgi:hypothetical protein
MEFNSLYSTTVVEWLKRTGIVPLLNCVLLFFFEILVIICYTELKTFYRRAVSPSVGSTIDVVQFLVSVRNTCWRFGYIIGCTQTDILCWLVSCAVSVFIRRGWISELYFLYKVWVSSLQAYVLSDLLLYFCISDVNCRTWWWIFFGRWRQYHFCYCSKLLLSLMETELLLCTAQKCSDDIIIVSICDCLRTAYFKAGVYISPIILQVSSMGCTRDVIEGGEAASLNDPRNGLHKWIILANVDIFNPPLHQFLCNVLGMRMSGWWCYTGRVVEDSWPRTVFLFWTRKTALEGGPLISSNFTLK